MPRPEKVQAVANIRERLDSAGAVFITEFAGLTVTEQAELRRGLRRADASYKVVKMTLARLAAAELGMEALNDVLRGPTGLAFSSGDPAPTAKALRDFAAEHVRLVIKGVYFDGDLLPPEKVIELADVEPRDVLLAKMAGLLQAPMANLAGLLAALPRNAATMFQQLIDKRTDDEPARAAADSVEPAAVAEDRPDSAAEEDAPSGESAGDGSAAEAAEEGGDDGKDE